MIYKTFSVSVNTETDFLDTIEDKEELMEIFMDLDIRVHTAKWHLAKVWMFGTTEDLTDEQQLAAAGLI